MCIILIGTMTGVVLVGVFFRYFLQNALAWTEEVSKFIMVWMTFMAAPIALRHGAHVGIKLLLDNVKGRLHQMLVIVGQLIILLLMGVCIKEGIALTLVAKKQVASSVDLSLGWIYLSIPLGSLMMFMIAFQQLISTLQKFIDQRVEDQ
ncbi:MAG: TRAP transporter small permease [Deltaproteobacteria bacterium]|nr:TRAP transporter small permease [Deltaproteobacteria bacterium]MBW2307833.1 TRAP transporter small permease [Deltaproteobacteria bacterium]